MVDNSGQAVETYCRWMGVDLCFALTYLTMVVLQPTLLLGPPRWLLAGRPGRLEVVIG